MSEIVTERPEMLLLPVAEGAPCGTDLRADGGQNSLYFRLKDARTTARVNERAAARSWFVPTAKHWVDVENGNILKTMLAQMLTGRLTVLQAARAASQNIAQTLNES